MNATSTALRHIDDACPDDPIETALQDSPALTDDELRSIALFESVELATLRPLLHASEIVELAPQDILISAGRPNHLLYAVLSGRLSVRLNEAESATIAEFGPGEAVGELSCIDRQPTSAFVVAETPVRVLAIDEELLWIIVNTCHSVSTNLLYTLARRLRSGNQIMLGHRDKLEQYQFHATVDALTGLFNRHWLSNMLPRQMHRSRLCGEPFSLLMVDIDLFKAYNDSHGHVAGDVALTQTATTLRDSSRPTDMAARFGGEEFLVLLPNCNLSGAQLAAERLRRKVEESRIAHANGQPLPGVTVSIGAGELTATGTVEDFIGVADAALYRAKNAGRNCVSI